MMSFEKDDHVAIASRNGDAVISAKEAVAIAKKEARETGGNVTIRDAISDAFSRP